MWGYQVGQGATILSNQKQCGTGGQGCLYYFTSATPVGSCSVSLRKAHPLDKLLKPTLELAQDEGNVGDSCAAQRAVFERWLKNEEEHPRAGI